jgi:YgiT-type zinc finger domain-containing protein
VIAVAEVMIKAPDYYLSSHAEEEMMDDGFERADVENAILKGFLQKKMTHDTRGTRYRIEGPSVSGRSMHVICRFRSEPDHHHRICDLGANMQCEFCGGETRSKKVKRSHWFQHQLYIVEDVEAEVCTECGERYFHATTLVKIDALLKKQHPVRARLDVEIVNMAQALAQQVN